ncbi:hydroxyacid dehydrogenase [Brachybacterium halotolerans subsp. kimchii]|uniref:hydroxyacid dehydrogenase n=1 Tax=Brachybacterium halotolerans TaxID=2795215 RepID=UPI001E37ADB0|nr:hydroxyacid dehydrogenase [Brachybacterium halotolerans]UEJ84404.1 hydroxyacid dehydrogenase [Brachybacterium halotolerans subsp. kimchii]
MKVLLAMPDGLQHRMFDRDQLERLAALADVDVERTAPDLSELEDDELSAVDVLLTGWGSPLVDAAALARMPRLRAIVHTAGTIRFVVSPAVWERGDIVVTSATEANAVPVAEFALAQILLAGKRTLAQAARHREVRDRRREPPVGERAGNFRSVVGLIGASRIGRLVAEHLRRFDLEVLISDPFVSAEEITALGGRKVELDDLFAGSDVVSLHAPDVPSTQGMVTARLLASMPDGATFLNTARPALVDRDALRAELLSGRISAVLDVEDELPADDPLWDVPTVLITPHIAGSQGNELHRMGESALEEVRRLAVHEPPRFPVDPRRLSVSA